MLGLAVAVTAAQRKVISPEGADTGLPFVPGVEIAGNGFDPVYAYVVAQMAVYQLLGIDREVPPILHHDKSLKVNFDALIKSFK